MSDNTICVDGTLVNTNDIINIDNHSIYSTISYHDGVEIVKVEVSHKEANRIHTQLMDSILKEHI